MHKNWMQHKNNSKELLEKLWTISKSYKSGYEPNVEKGLNKLKAKIAKENQLLVSAKVIPISRKRWLTRIAAAITLLITCAFLFNLGVNNSTSLQQVVITEGLMENIMLPDGSSVWINKHSKLSFPKTFSKTERVVILEGEGFFKVTKNPNQPFIVRTKESEVKVLGTQFNVRAYSKESTTIIEVEEGSVLFNIPSIQQKKVLKANNKVIFNKANATISKIEPLNWKDTAWKAKQLNFDNRPIIEVLAYLNENFEIEVTYSAEALINCPFNATLVNNHPETILKQIKSAFPLIGLKKINTNQYRLSGNCN